MASGKVASWAHGKEFVDEATLFPETGVLARARERGNELGATPVLPGAGALMRVLAAAVQARSAVEIGTGSGVGSLYLLAGMHPEGVLTTIDPEVENQRAARESFTEAKIRPARVRTIAGSPATSSAASPITPTTWCPSRPTPTTRPSCWPMPRGCCGPAACW